jgi:sugar lactone lactonase YvrE
MPAPTHHRTGAHGFEVLPQPDVLIPAQAEVGEGPVIDQRTGRLCWVDITQGMDYEHDLADRSAGVGMLHRWDGTSPSIPIADGFTLPNGLGWNHEDTIMYLIDSMTDTLLSAPYDADDGLTGVFTPLCRIEKGLPDGLAVDVDGSIWIAAWGAAELRRFNRTGELTGIVPMPVSQPSSCAFGTDGTLYITTARASLTPQELANQPHAGSMFALATNTHGVPIRAFAR